MRWKTKDRNVGNVLRCCPRVAGKQCTVATIKPCRCLSRRTLESGLMMYKVTTGLRERPVNGNGCGYWGYTSECLQRGLCLAWSGRSIDVRAQTVTPPYLVYEKERLLRSLDGYVVEF